MHRTHVCTAVGIDVGGIAKGYHAVALCAGEIVARFATTNAHAMREWVCERSALAVAVDAPCRFNASRARAAERALARDGMRVFATPSKAVARATPFYHWMLNGARLYGSLARDFPLFVGNRRIGPVAFETFPHAVACTLAGRTLMARNKYSDRRAVLEASGIDTAMLANIDFLDAALCALAAQCFMRGEYTTYGEARSGLIIVPSRSARRSSVHCTPRSSLLP